MRWLALTGLFLVVSAGMTLLTSALHFDRDPRSCLAAMLDGTAHRPFVLRRLVPDVIGTLARWTPHAWQERVLMANGKWQMGNPPYTPLSKGGIKGGMDERRSDEAVQFRTLWLGRDGRVAFAHLLLVLSVWGCYFAVLWLWRGLFLSVWAGPIHGRDAQATLHGRDAPAMLYGHDAQATLHGRDAPATNLAWFWEWVAPPLALGLVYPLLNWRHGVHIYDPATLVLYSSALWALLHGQRWLYGLIFVLAVWHKETAFLLIAWWAVAFVRPVGLIRSREWLFPLVMLMFYVGVRLWLGWLYRENAGSAFEFWLTERNLPFLLSLFTDFGGRHVRFLLLLAVLIGLPAWGWQQKPLLLRRLMVAGLLVMGVPWLFFGILDEFRALLELYPLWLMLCVPGGYSSLSNTATEPSGMLSCR